MRGELIEWIIRQKIRYNIGGSYLADSIIGGIVAGSLIIGNYWLIIVVIAMRWIGGYILIRKKIPQIENRIVLQWTNPYMDGKLNGNRKTNRRRTR